jgi:hypothetical protein
VGGRGRPRGAGGAPTALPHLVLRRTDAGDRGDVGHRVQFLRQVLLRQGTLIVVGFILFLRYFLI